MVLQFLLSPNSNRVARPCRRLSEHLPPPYIQTIVSPNTIVPPKTSCCCCIMLQLVLHMLPQMYSIIVGSAFNKRVW